MGVTHALSLLLQVGYLRNFDKIAAKSIMAWFSRTFRSIAKTYCYLLQLIVLLFGKAL